MNGTEGTDRLASAEATLRKLIAEGAGDTDRLHREVSGSFGLNADERIELATRFAVDIHAARIKSKLSAERKESISSTADGVGQRIYTVLRLAAFAFVALFVVGLVSNMVVQFSEARERRAAAIRDLRACATIRGTPHAAADLDDVSTEAIESSLAACRRR